MVDQKAQPFIKLWAPHPLQEESVCQAFADVRAAAVLEPLEPLDIAGIRAAAHAMKPRAGLGVDVLTPLDFERLPDLALDELRGLYAVVEETLVWPSQVSLALGRLLPKNLKGGRVIGVLSMFTR
eukprot:3313381-Pyramimonas_sp.AAC.1